MIDWENFTDEQTRAIDWHNLPLEDRISRLRLCSKKINKLYDELSLIGVGNLPIDANNSWPGVPMDYYDKDIDTNLDILCGLTRLEETATARADELSKLIVKDAV